MVDRKKKISKKKKKSKNINTNILQTDTTQDRRRIIGEEYNSFISI